MNSVSLAWKLARSKETIDPSQVLANGALARDCLLESSLRLPCGDVVHETVLTQVNPVLPQSFLQLRAFKTQQGAFDRQLHRFGSALTLARHDSFLPKAVLLCNGHRCLWQSCGNLKQSRKHNTYLEMINIVSIRCSLAFTPYLEASTADFITHGSIGSRVVRQGGHGLIIRSQGDLVLRHENRQVSLGKEEVTHFATTFQMRREFYDVSIMPNEVVLATIGSEILLSHPQSDIWLSRNTVCALTQAFESAIDHRPQGLPDWLKMSIGGGTLLLSDERTGRWVLLGEEHLRELDRRLVTMSESTERIVLPKAPTIAVKNLTIHLQSAFKLAAILNDFASSGTLTDYEEETPNYLFKVVASTEGIELSDLDNRVALTAREARKWAGIVLEELKRLNAKLVERKGIRTVFAESGGGKWILQWGDEIFISKQHPLTAVHAATSEINAIGYLVGKRIGEYLLLLSPATSDCVALTEAEAKYLADGEPAE